MKSNRPITSSAFDAAVRGIVSMPRLPAALILAVCSIGVWLAFAMLSHERDELLADADLEMVPVISSVKSGVLTSVVQSTAAARGYFQSGLTPEDFAPARDAASAAARRQRIETLIRSGMTNDPQARLAVSVFDATGRIIAGADYPHVPASTLADILRRHAEPRSSSNYFLLRDLPAAAALPTSGKSVAIDNLVLLHDGKAGLLGGFIFPTRLSVTHELPVAGAMNGSYRAVVMEASTRRVMAAYGAGDLARRLPEPGRVIDSDGYEEALRAALASPDSVANFATTDGSGRELWCRLDAARYASGLVCVAQCDRSLVLAPWRAEVRRTVLVGTIFVLSGALVLLFDMRRRRWRAAGIRLASEIALRRQHEADLAAMNDRLEALVAQRESELLTSNDRLNEANRELQGYATTVSHDLRAPIRAVHGFADMLIEDYGATMDATTRETLDDIRARSLRMSALVEDILRISRTTHPSLNRTAVDLSALARDIVENLGRDHPSRRVHVEIEANCVADADESIVRTCLRHLLDNAWKYTSRREEARIRFGRDGAHGYFVADNGIGFDPADADRLFKPFSRLHRNEDYEGAGIGLAVVARLIRLHGGEVFAEGRPGEGATFRFSLPPQEPESA